MSPARYTRFFAGAFIAALLAATLGCGGGVECSALFESAKTLKKGDPVTQNGVPVGKVSAIDIQPNGAEVKLRIDKKHIQATQSGSYALIGTGGVSQWVELHPRGSGAPPIAEGERLVGYESKLSLMAQKVKDAAVPAAMMIGEKIKGAVVSVNNYVHSPEGQKLAADTKQFLIEAQGKIGQGVQDFRTKHPEFEAKLKQQLEDAKKAGNQALIKVLQQIQDSLKEQQ